jgi:hypothetical protein
MYPSLARSGKPPSLALDPHSSNFTGQGSSQTQHPSQTSKDGFQSGEGVQTTDIPTLEYQQVRNCLECAANSALRCVHQVPTHTPSAGTPAFPQPQVAQYATYPTPSIKQEQWNPAHNFEAGNSNVHFVEYRPWLPLPFKTWFWIPFMILMVAGAVGLEVALHLTKQHRGKSTHFSTELPFNSSWQDGQLRTSLVPRKGSFITST